MSSPKIAIHIFFIIMGKVEKTAYLKRSQKDYSMLFKFEVIKEVESGFISWTLLNNVQWIKAYF